MCPAVELAGGRESQDAAETSVWGKPITNKHGYLMKIHGDLLGLDGDLVRIPYLNILELVLPSRISFLWQPPDVAAQAYC